MKSLTHTLLAILLATLFVFCKMAFATPASRTILMQSASTAQFNVIQGSDHRYQLALETIPTEDVQPAEDPETAQLEEQLDQWRNIKPDDYQFIPPNIG